MAEITPPDLDPRDEETITATAIDALPAELTDRNPASVAVKLLEAAGAFYGAVTFYLNQWPETVELRLLSLLGITRLDPVASAVVLSFTATGAGATVPAGTVVKTSTDSDAIRFVTDSELVLAPSATDTVTATAETAGAAGNVGAGELTLLDSPISGVASVTNNAAAQGGSDTEDIEDTKARAPLVNRANSRAVTDEDHEGVALGVAGVERVKVTTDRSSRSVHILATDANAGWYANPDNAVDLALRTSVETALDAVKIAGTQITAIQHAIRAVAVDTIEIELEAGYAQATVEASLETAFRNYLDAFATFDSDGNQIGGGWAYGRTLYYNELVALADGVDGVVRVGAIQLVYTDDYDNTSTTLSSFTSLAPASDGLEGLDHALIHQGFDIQGITVDIIPL